MLTKAERDARRREIAKIDPRFVNDYLDEIAALDTCDDLEQRAIDAEARARALEVSLATLREVSPEPHCVATVPGNAWDVIIMDRDKWKARAIEAEKERDEARAIVQTYAEAEEETRERHAAEIARLTEALRHVRTAAISCGSSPIALWKSLNVASIIAIVEKALAPVASPAPDGANQRAWAVRFPDSGLYDRDGHEVPSSEATAHASIEAAEKRAEELVPPVEVVSIESLMAARGVGAGALIPDASDGEANARACIDAANALLDEHAKEHGVTFEGTSGSGLMCEGDPMRVKPMCRQTNDCRCADCNAIRADERRATLVDVVWLSNERFSAGEMSRNAYDAVQDFVCLLSSGRVGKGVR